MRKLAASLTLACYQTLCAQVTVDLNGTAQSTALCYHDGMDVTFTYVDSTVLGDPIALLFCQGNMEACCDSIFIFDGTDASAPLLYAGNGGGDLTGVLAISTNTGSALTLRILSNASISCPDQNYDPMQWVAFRMALGEQDCMFASVQDRSRNATPTIWPTVASDLLFIARPREARGSVVAVCEASGRTCMTHVLIGPVASMDISTLAPGTYIVHAEASTGEQWAQRFVVQR